MVAVFTNNAYSTLASGITDVATSITLTTGEGARFPTLSGADYFYATLIDTANNLEIVKCTAISTDTLTVVRAQESTTAQAYSAGDRIELRITAAGLTDVVAQAVTAQTAAEAAQTSAEAVYDSFDDRYLGAKAAAPTLDNDGNALGDGAMYFNTTTPDMWVYDLGNTVWVTVSSLTASIAAAASESAAAASESAAAASAASAAAAAAGIFWKAPVLVATTTNIALSGEQTIDGVLTSTSRVLVKDQTAPAENGVYVTAAGAWARATPMDVWDEFVGAAVIVSEGTVNADTGWLSTADAGGTIGVTDVPWTVLTSSGLLPANNLSDLTSVSTARTNLGLGALATLAAVDTAQITDGAVDPTKAIAGVNAQTGTTYTYALTDNLKVVAHSNVSAKASTIPLNASVAFTVDKTRIDIMNEGAGDLTVSGATGVTVNGVSAGSFTVTQYQGATLIKRGTDTWYAPNQTVA